MGLVVLLLKCAVTLFIMFCHALAWEWTKAIFYKRVSLKELFGLVTLWGFLFSIWAYWIRQYFRYIQ